MHIKEHTENVLLCFNTQVFNNTKKYHVFSPMGRFQLESIYLYFPPMTVENKGKLILTQVFVNQKMINVCENPVKMTPHDCHVVSSLLCV